jgi:hypothetical protein
MKRVTRCYNCKNITRIAGSFKAEIEEVTVVTDQFGMSERKLIKSKITLCRDCAGIAGYKVKRPKPVYILANDGTQSGTQGTSGKDKK